MYKLTESDSVIRLSDSSVIPSDPSNIDRMEYEAWIAKGNTPLPIDPITEEEQRALFKLERDEAVAAIKVTSSLGRTFDGDEQSTTRMLKPIKVLESEPEGSTTLWVLADNTPAQVGLTEFLEVLKLAGLEQTRLWLPPS